MLDLSLASLKNHMDSKIDLGDEGFEVLGRLFGVNYFIIEADVDGTRYIDIKEFDPDYPYVVISYLPKARHYELIVLVDTATRTMRALFTGDDTLIKLLR
jgi:hypothetical protein